MAITFEMLKKSSDEVGVEISQTQAVNRSISCAGCILEQQAESIPVARKRSHARSSEQLHVVDKESLN
jgi:hypothetical protein